MKHQRHYISLIFGAILLVPLLAIGILQIGQAYIKSTREERLGTEKLLEVVVPAGKLIWEEQEKELWVGDRMFDVAFYTIKDGYYYLTGVFDDDETEIAGSLLHSIFSEKNINLLQLIFLLQCFLGCILLVELTNNYIVIKRAKEQHLALLPSPVHLVLGPPPRW